MNRLYRWVDYHIVFFALCSGIYAFIFTLPKPWGRHLWLGHLMCSGILLALNAAFAFTQVFFYEHKRAAYFLVNLGIVVAGLMMAGVARAVVALF
jgi:hypothetical protein